MKWAGNLFALAWALPALLAVTGCRRDMFNQPKANPLRESNFFQDGAASRPLPPHTVSNEESPYEASFYSGMDGTNYVHTYPFHITRTVLERGRERYDIYCAPCHGLTGDGAGMVIQRGLAVPPPLAIDRLRTSPPGHFVAAIARGYGVMFPQASQVEPSDRWAIAAYVQALQLSQHGALADLPENEAAKLKAMP